MKLEIRAENLVTLTPEFTLCYLCNLISITKPHELGIRGLLLKCILEGKWEDN